MVEEAISVAEANERSGKKLVIGLGDELDAIAVSMTPDEPASAREILNSLVLSNRLYENQDKNNYESNSERERSMKDLFLRYYRRAQSFEEAPRVLLRFGGNHVIRGLSFTNVLSLGTFVSEFAIAEGSQSLNINVICGRDGETAGTGSALGRVLPCDAPAMVPWLKPFGVAARWDVTLFDHKALRSRIGNLKVAPELTRFVYGFDASVLIADTNPVRFEPPDPHEILTRAAQACSEVQSASFQGKWAGHGILKEAFPAVEGKIFLERIHTDDPIGGRFSLEGTFIESSAEKPLRIAYDGKLVRSLQEDALLYAEPESGGLSLMKSVRRLVFDPFVSSKPLENELKASSLEMEALDQLDGEYYYVVRVKYPEGFDPFVKEARWFIGIEDFRPRKVEYLFQEKDERGAAVLSLSELRVNPGINPDVFIPEAPDGFPSKPKLPCGKVM